MGCSLGLTFGHDLVDLAAACRDPQRVPEKFMNDDRAKVCEQDADGPIFRPVGRDVYSVPAVSPPPALAAALYFDVDLSADPAPLATIIKSLFGAESPDGTFTHWINRVDDRRAPPPQPLDLGALLRLVTDGAARTAAAETKPNTPDSDHMLVLARTTPSDKGPERFALASCRYDLQASFGSHRLHEVGVRRAIDAIVAFADAVAVTAGTIHWAETAVFASCLASCGDSPRLTREQSNYISDAMYWRPRWGTVIRGPAWGTFLGAAHVEQLDGLARIEREGGCARIVALASGGAFLQATPVDDPIIDGIDDGRLVALARFLEPVMGKRT
jgi:hypothetical protein